MARELTWAQTMDQRLLTDFRKPLWRPFMRAVREYDLIRPGDRIAVCVSGGKDSMLLAVLMRLLRRHSEVPFEVVNLVMDPGYRPEHRAQIEANIRRLALTCTIVESDVFEVAEAQAESGRAGSAPARPCFLCARMRRGCLYRHAQALGCNKLALGHHYDDVIETTLMAMLWGGQIQAMPPKLRAQNFPGMSLIRPMYQVREADICAWRDAFDLRFLRCACRFADAADHDEAASARARTKRLIAELHVDNPKVEQNLFNSIRRVQLDTLVGWKYRGEQHSFLENWDD